MGFGNYVRMVGREGGVWALVMLMLGASALQAQSEPRFERRGDDERVVLPAAMRKALTKFDSTFRTWRYREYAIYLRGDSATEREALFGVVGDFNGDGRMDVALDGRTAKRAALLVILSKGVSDYVVVNLDSALSASDTLPTNWPGTVGLEGYLRAVHPGVIEVPVWSADDEYYPLLDTIPGKPGERFITVKNDAFMSLEDDKTSALCVYARGRWWWVTTGD